MPTKNLALITAPGFTKRIVKDLKAELPELLGYYVTEQYTWHVEFHEDPLTGQTNVSKEVLSSAIDRKNKEEWDYLIALTDLPLFENDKPVIAEAYSDDKVALISLPGFGLAPMQKRVREAILQLMNEMYYGSSDADREEAEHLIRSKDERFDDLKNKKSTRLVGRRIFEILSPMKRETPTNTRSNVDVRFTVRSRVIGLLRIVSGMVQANRPWEMFPAFAKILVIAFTTGAYALVFQTLWQMSTNYSIDRAILMTIISTVALTMWIIFSHGLWEKKNDPNAEFIRKLYNATTFFTLFLAVLMYYVILFTMFLVTTLLLMPMAQIETYTSEPPAWTIYPYTAWIGASLSTIIGAIGSAFEDKEDVLNSTYGYRQQQRHKKIQERREKEDEEENYNS